MNRIVARRIEQVYVAVFAIALALFSLAPIAYAFGAFAERNIVQPQLTASAKLSCSS